MADNRMNVVSGIELAGGPGQGPVVTPQSTALMSDMFRKGVINVQDIVQGIDRHEAAKVQQKGAQMALAEASDPAAVAARQAEVQLRGATAQGALALQPLQQQATAANLKSLVWASKLQGFGIRPEQVVQLAQDGFTVPMNLDREPTAQDAALIKTMLQQRADFHQAKGRLVEVEKELNNPKTFTRGDTTITAPQYLGKELTQEMFNEANTKLGGYTRAADWVAAGAQKPAVLFPGTPGEVSVQPAAPAAVAPAAPPPVVPKGAAYQPITSVPLDAPPGDQLRALAVTSGVPAEEAATMSDLQLINAIGAATNARQPAPAAAPVVAPSQPAAAAPAAARSASNDPQVRFTNKGMVVEFPPTDVAKSPTESQQKSASALTRMREGESALDALTQRGFDPTSYMAWVQNLLPNWAGALKPEELRAYNQATSNWVQGLLRLESGAAIAYKEQKWYVDTFFPQVGDTPVVVAQKRDARLAMQGFLDKNNSRFLAQDPVAAAEYNHLFTALKNDADLVKAKQPQATPQVPGAAGGAISLKSGQKIKVVGRDANGLPLVEYVK